MQVDEYLGFRKGDEVLDAAELTAGTARIKEIHIVPDDMGLAAIAVMENGAERYITQLKKVSRRSAEDRPNNVTVLHG
ncbi:hypothetical protein [Azospirillum canadense]|uniref:hypothetical protein n=1 Tax=Azospirillum canadense TaxID=403962 RepID=UPI002226985A|nr:hypothetical protein [Azospirillum canadense]MCW2243000.1 hypothetical protein [Azospirillum canadense]